MLEKDIFVLGRWMDCLGVEEELLFCLSIVGGSEERCARAPLILMESEFSKEPVSLQPLRNKCTWWL